MKTYFRILGLLLLIWAMGSVSSCSDNPDGGSNERKDIELTPESRAVSEGLIDWYATFTGDVAAYLDANPEEDKNFVVSPLSAAILLSMTGNAVDGKLREEIMAYLGMDDPGEMNDFASTLMKTLPTLDRKTDLSFANSVWANSNYSLNDRFTSLVTNSYRADVSSFNPDDPVGSAIAINRWCMTHTDNIINNLVNEGDINHGLLALLLNAMYFKSEWQEEELFDKRLSAEKTFYGLLGEKQVSIMKSKQVGLSCRFEEDLTYVRVPFGNGSYAFEIILPSEDKDICELSCELSGCYASIKSASKSYSKVTLLLPRFNVAYDLKMTEVLAARALPMLSSDNIPFSLFKESASGGVEFKQKISFEVNEDGAKAVVVTSASLGYTSLGPDPSEPVEINVNRPFMFFVTEQSTGACLVSGRITDL